MHSDPLVYALGKGRTFLTTWIRLAEDHHCDEAWGAEFTRVRQEWYDAGCPVAIDKFIMEAANRPAPQ